MKEFAYWKHWQAPYRILFTMLLVLLAGSILYFVVSLLYGHDFVISWAQSPSLEPIQVPLPALDHPLLPVQTWVDTYVVKQRFWGTPLQVNLPAALISLSFFGVALAVIITCITTFSRLWYFVGITAICAVFVLLRLEQLGLAGRFDNTPLMVVLVLLLPLSYYFHAIRPTTSFLVRLAVFALLLGAFALAIKLLATVPYPFLYLVNYGMPAWLGLSLLLLLLVGPEIIAGILYLITASNTPESRGSMRHFAIASGLYLLNLILYYLEEREYLDLGIYYIGPFWILIISILAGLWTLRMRSEHLRQSLLTEPYGLLLYVALAMLGLSTVAYAAATANNPLLETFEDAILYTHIGMGLALFLYIIANFYGLLRENQRVYRVLYKPQLMPLFTARLAGLIILIGFVAVRGNYAYFQPIAGYYNGIGDLYAVQGDLLVSQNYYKLGSQYQIRNHRSNYALASLAIGANQPRPAIAFLQEALERDPSPYAYVNLANLYQQRNLFFEALFTLRQGIRAYPNAGPIYNNLGLSYGNTQLVDSAFYFLRAAAGDDESEEVALANMLAVLAGKGINLSPDSLLSWDIQQTIALQNNLLALANQQGYQLGQLHPALQVLGNDSSFAVPAYLLNYALQAPKVDTSLVAVARRGFEKARLSAMEEQWGLAYALMLHRLPDYYGAFAAMQDLADRSQFNNITYYKILGQWAMEQGAPRLAADWFRQAHMRGDVGAGFYRAMALAEAGRTNEAAEGWISLPDTALSATLKQKKTLALLALSDTPVEGLPQPVEVAATRLRMRAGSLIPAEINALLAILPQEGKAQALTYLARQALKAGETEEAQLYLTQLQGQSLTPERSKELEAMWLQYQFMTGAQAKRAASPADTLQQLKQQAAQQLAAGDTTAALQHLQYISRVTPFAEDAILLEARLLNARQNADAAYALLRRALLLNSYSIPLLEAYVLQSMQMGLESYAEDALLELEISSPPDRYKIFLNRFEKIKESLSTREKW